MRLIKTLRKHVLPSPWQARGRTVLPGPWRRARRSLGLVLSMSCEGSDLVAVAALAAWVPRGPLPTSSGAAVWVRDTPSLI